MPTRPRTSSPRRAFTLIELLVVMAILVVLVLVAIPAFDYITAARGTDAGVNVAAAMVGRARNLALSRTDSKYIGVLFYNEPDSDRDAMQLVEVDNRDTATVLQRYFGWQSNFQYRTAITSGPLQKEADVVFSQAIDATVGGIFTNKPTVRRYVALKDGTGHRPPGSATNFVDAYWNTSPTGNMIPVTLDAEVQYLPRGVRARVLKSNADIKRPGLILFDKQGRVANRKWGISNDKDGSVDGGEKLLEAMGISKDDEGLGISEDRRSGPVLLVFDDKQVTDSGVDAKKPDLVDAWVVGNVNKPDGGITQYTVGLQSGELITASAAR